MLSVRRNNRTAGAHESCCREWRVPAQPHPVVTAPRHTAAATESIYDVIEQGTGRVT